MTKLTNKHTAELNVLNMGVTTKIDVGETVDVDGRSNWSKNIFVKAGWLEVEESSEDLEAKAEAEAKAKAEAEAKAKAEASSKK